MAVLSLLAVIVVAVGATSTRAFCAAGMCHTLQADALSSYENSSHSEISCLACHMPVNADPVTFLIHKAEAGVSGLIGVASGAKPPINAESELAMDPRQMPERQCTQCHTANRKLTPSRGIVIDHAVHSRNKITCTQCHNRIGHDENGVTLTKGVARHADFMKMQGCFRCHDMEGKKRALGDCQLCHPIGFKLKPANHDLPGFYTHYGDSTGHAKLALADKTGTYCSMCHVRVRFCDRCHGVQVPHPKGFVETHGPAGKKSPAVCANCHAKGVAVARNAEFCNACHHKQGDPTKPWLPQHPAVVVAQGTYGCFKCHPVTYCAHCHVRGLGKK